MKQFFKHVCTGAVFIIILAILLGAASFVFSPKDNSKKAGMQDPTAHGYLAEPENSIDVLFVGDSECYSAFSPRIIWKQQGITSYVCGTPGQKLYYSLEMIEEVFKTQSPKIVVLETNAIYRKFARKSVAVNEVELVLPIFRYHDRWKTLSADDLNFNTQYTHIEKNRGYRVNKDVRSVSPGKYMKKTKIRETIPKINLNYMDKIISLCEEHGAKLILVSTPSTKNWSYKRHNGIKEYAEKKGLKYIDLNTTKKLKIDWTKDTRDHGDHLNHSGAKKVSKYMGKYFKKTGLFEDKRGRTEYASWDE